MTPQTVLAIDQGTSGTKAVVVDSADGVLASAEEPVRPVPGPRGAVEIAPQELLGSVLTAGRRALERAGRPVDAISLANQGETVLAWDPVTGAPLSPAIVWQDRRSESIVAELAGARDLFAARTGLVLDPYFSAPKMAWLRRHVTREGVVTTSDSWLIHQLCGEFVTDASTASRSLVAGIDEVAWDRELLTLFGLQDEALPRITGCDEVVGTTSRFGPPVPVAGLIVDQQAALLGQSCLDPGSAKCTFGTGAFLLANTGGHPVHSSAGLTASVAWRLRGRTTYCLDGQVYAAASAVRWLQELGLISGPEDIDRIAGEDVEAVLCVPALAGLAAPWWRADASATLTGMTMATRAGHIVLATMHGIAAQVAELASSVAADLGGALPRLRVDGGLVRCRTLMQATADILQVPVDVDPVPDATARGAATTGLLALEPSLDVSDAVPSSSVSLSYEPVWSPDRAASFRARWRAAAEAALPR